MVKNNEIPIEVKKPFETVYEIKEEEIRLPNLSEITDENGKVKLSPELIEKLRDPNARFRINLAVFEEWAKLIIPCPAKNCSSMGNKEVSNWIHKRSQCQSAYERHLEWSTEAKVKCSYCDNPSHIMNWSFKCHNHVDYHPMDGTKFNRAIVAAINYGSINSDFSTKLLTWFEDNPF